MKKPPALGNINAAYSGTLQVIDNTHDVPKWKTIGTCADTPGAIGWALYALAAAGHDTKSIWIRTADGRRPLF